MLEELKGLYVDSGIWAQPILISTALLFLAGWIMLFTVRVIKKFVLYSVFALLLPNAIGLMGYWEESDTLQEAIIERGETLSEEMAEAADDLTFSPLYLGLAGSGLTLLLGVAGIARIRFSQRTTSREGTSRESP